MIFVIYLLVSGAVFTDGERLSTPAKKSRVNESAREGMSRI